MPFGKLSTNPKGRATVPKKQQLLFIHQGALGDQLLALPLIGQLQKSYHITYSARNPGLELMQHLTHMQTVSLDHAPLQLEEALKGTWDQCISVGSIEWLNINTHHHVTLNTNIAHQQPIWQSWAHQVLNCNAEPFYISRVKPESPHLIIAPGSGSPQKNWPLDNYIELSQLLTREIDISVLMGPVELEHGMDSRWQQQGGAGCLVRHPSASRLLELYRCATHFMGNDSGPAHLASVYHLKGCAIFLHSDPSIWSPYGEQLKTLIDPPQKAVERFILELL